MTTIHDFILDEDLAREWKCSRRTLARYETEPDGLPFVMIGGKKYRHVPTCRDWLLKRMTHPNPRRGARAA